MGIAKGDRAPNLKEMLWGGGMDCCSWGIQHTAAEMVTSSLQDCEIKTLAFERTEERLALKGKPGAWEPEGVGGRTGRCGW